MLSALLVFTFVAVISARIFDTVHTVPQGWSNVSPALPGDRVTLKLGLKQQNIIALEDVVLAVSTPGNRNYGKHLSRDDLRSYVAPHERSVGEVTAWLEEHGIAPDVDNDWMSIATDVETANKILDADFKWYKHHESGIHRLRSLSYSIPDALADHIDTVQPTTRFGHLGVRKSTFINVTILEDHDETVPDKQVPATTTNSAAAACSVTVTPQCLKAQYNINYTPQSPDNWIGFASYLEQYARYNDLKRFQAQILPEAAGQNFSVTLINNGLNDQSYSGSSVEANLDVQYILGVSHPVPIQEFSTGGRGPLIPGLSNDYPDTNEPYLEFLLYLLSLPDDELPPTLTTSYGEEEQSVPKDYALRVCNMFMQLGARGVSVLFSSGDTGPGNSCKSNTDNTTTTFLPTFPAGCPYVTSVGATTYSSPERGASFSSGGFSIYHPRPAWQDDAVPPYLESIGATYDGLFNASGRGIPDVSAQGESFMIIDKNRTAHASGSSASAPVFAGVVALLNDARISQGLSPLGFLNPWLYSNPDALLDITEGYSSGCFLSGGGLPVSGARWNCTAGWDPVTGLGTPLFDRLLAVAAPEVANE